MKKTLISLVILAVALSACSAIGSSQIESARRRWQAAGISHYRYELTVGCFCGFTDRMPLSIEVKDGQVISMRYRDGTPVGGADRGMFSRYETIDKLIDFTAEAQKKADEIHIQYEPTYGFPSAVNIDFIKQAMDDELSLTVSGFEALP